MYKMPQNPAFYVRDLHYSLLAFLKSSKNCTRLKTVLSKLLVCNYRCENTDSFALENSINFLVYETMVVKSFLHFIINSSDKEFIANHEDICKQYLILLNSLFDTIKKKIKVDISTLVNMDRDFKTFYEHFCMLSDLYKVKCEFLKIDSSLYYKQLEL